MKASKTDKWALAPLLTWGNLPGLNWRAPVAIKYKITTKEVIVTNWNPHETNSL